MTLAFGLNGTIPFFALTFADAGQESSERPPAFDKTKSDAGHPDRELCSTDASDMARYSLQVISAIFGC